MIGLGAEVLTGERGDVRERHLEYARRAGRLVMVVSAWDAPGLRAAQVSKQLTVYPVAPRVRVLFPLAAYRVGAQICRNKTVDLIVAQDPFATGLAGYWLKRRFRLPLVVSNHSFFFDNREWLAERPLRHRVFNRTGKWLLRRADGLRVVNAAEGRKYVALGIPADRVWILPTPVPLERFLSPPAPADLEALRRRLGLEGRRVLLWVGDPRERAKDLPTLLRALALAAARDPAVMLVLVGDVAGTPHILDLARTLGVSPHLVAAGRVPHAEVPLYYHVSECYVHTSRYEGTAKVMLEAAAAGKPILSTRIAGIDAVVEEGVTGLLAPVGDAEEVARLILDLLQDPPRARAMGEAARRRITARFNREVMIDGIVRMWHDVVRGRLNASPIAVASVGGK
jgi:glycosyltransferase involved in cell wall biosynthesis